MERGVYIFDFLFQPLEFKVFIGYIITVLVAIAGWSIAVYQFNKQYQRNIELSNIQKRRDYEIDSVKSMIPFVEETQKSAIELVVFLTILKEGIKLRGVMVDFTHHYFKDSSGRFSEKYYSTQITFSNFLYFFDHRQFIKYRFKDQIDQIIHMIGKQHKLKEVFKDQLMNIEITRIKTGSLFSAEEVRDLELAIANLANCLDENAAQMAKLSISIQNEYLSELFGYKTNIEEQRSKK